MKYFNIFFNPLWLIENFFTLGVGGGDDKPDYVPIKPVKMTTGFATALADAEKGKYNYTLNPELAQLRDYFYNAANQQKATPEQLAYANQVGQFGQSLFNQAASSDIGSQTSAYYNALQNILAPQREQENIKYADSLFKLGRTGAAVGYGEGYVNPEQFALLQAREQQNAQLALGAEDRARQIRAADTNLGLSLADSSNALMMQPYSNVASLFGRGADIENLGIGVLSNATAAVQNQIAQQQRAQEYENATTDGGKGGLGGALGTIGQVAGTYFGGPVGGAIGGTIGGALGGGGYNAALQGGINSLVGSGFSGLWSGSSPSSGLGSLFGSSGGWGNANVGTFRPTTTTMSPFGSAPVNYGGGTIGPRF